VTAPHLVATATLRRRGGFFVPAGVGRDHTRPVPSAWVQWEAPAELSPAREPVVLVHGGGGQSTDWLWAVDGQPGWAELFVAAGHPTYLFDRPGHGRSAWHPEVLGTRSPAPDLTFLAELFNVEEDELRAETSGRFAPIAASTVGPLADPVLAQASESAALGRLLALIGPATIVTHSAGAPGVWLTADRHPELVRCVVAVEPLGPPYGGQRHALAMSEGLAAFPLAARGGNANAVDEPHLERVPALVVTAAHSGHHQADVETVRFLRGLDVIVDHLELADKGIVGDGHGVIFDVNSTAAFHEVYAWIAAQPEGRRYT
jgi:pimeloyl-ACP methyl ester carboxylesterase